MKYIYEISAIFVFVNEILQNILPEDERYIFNIIIINAL